MKNWFKTYIFSLRKDLVFILVSDVLFLLLMELILKKIPAPFPVFVKIGDISVTLSISFMASFIFYFVQVHLPEVRQKAHIYPRVASLFRGVLINEKALLTNFVGVRTYDELTESEIKNGAINRNINIPNAPLRFAGLNRNANWMEYCFYRVDKIDQKWEMIMKYSSYLDSKCISILADIQENSLLVFLRSMRGIYNTTRFSKLNDIDDLFLNFWKAIQEQEMYYKDVFDNYQQ